MRVNVQKICYNMLGIAHFMRATHGAPGWIVVPYGNEVPIRTTVLIFDLNLFPKGNLET